MNTERFDKNANAGKFNYVPVDLKTFAYTEDDSGLNLTGYFVIFNRLSTDRGGFFALIPPGSMVIPNYDIVALYNHNDDHILGRVSNGRLSFTQDDVGIKMTLSLTNTQFNRDLITDVQAGNIAGQSFGMKPIETRTETIILKPEDVDANTDLGQYVGQSVTVEVYDKWEIFEVTMTGVPAFPQTTLQSFAKIKEGIKQNRLVELYRKRLELLSLKLNTLK